MATYKSIKYIIPTEAVEHTDSINALADVDTTTVAPSVGQTLKWSAANSRWQPADLEEAAASSTQKAIFGFGFEGGASADVSITNLVSSTGVVATDTTGVGSARNKPAASSYGGDKAIFSKGGSNTVNLVSNLGVMSSDVTAAATINSAAAAASYGGDKVIFGFGYDGSVTNTTNLVSNTAVVASDTTGVGTVRKNLGATGYGGDKAIFGFGQNDTIGNSNLTNLVSNTGVVASDSTGVGTTRHATAGSGYGSTGQALFFMGQEDSTMYGDSFTNVTNLISSTGVVSSDTASAGSGAGMLAGSGYGGDKAIFGFGRMRDPQYSYMHLQMQTNKTNLVSNTGVVASDTTGVGSARYSLGAAGYSSTA